MNINVVLDLIETLRENVSDYNTRRNVYVSIIGIMEPYFDNDDLESCLGEDEAFDEAWEIVNPPDGIVEEEEYADFIFSGEDDESNFS